MNKTIMKSLLFFILPLSFIISSCNLNPSQVTYTVSHYQQNIENDEYTLVENEVLVGNAGEKSTAKAKNYEGFRPLDFDQVLIESGITISIKYDRNLITCIFDYNGGFVELPDGSKLTYSLVTGRFGAPLVKPEPEKEGVVLEAWYDSEGNIPQNVFTVNKTFYASYVAKTSARYTVHHFFQNLENDDYTEDVSKKNEFYGNIGTKTYVQGFEVKGFKAKTIEQKIILNDDSTQVNIYYDRIPVTFYFDLAGGNGEEKITKKYGTIVTSSIINNPRKENSDFSGWNPDLPGEFLSDQKFTAIWDMPSYTVEYYFENINDSDFSKDSNYADEIHYGKNGVQTDFIPKIIPGFLSEPVSQIVINSNSDNIIKVYYRRKIITLYIDLAGGIGSNFIQGKYGEENAAIAEKLLKLNKPNRAGYILNETNSYAYSDEVCFSLEYDETTPIVAQWAGGVPSSYEVIVLKEKLDYEGDGQKYEETDRVVLTGNSGEFTKALQDLEAKTISIGNKQWQFDYYEPFGLENIEIKGDDSSVLYLYFDRVFIDITFNLTGGNIDGDESDVVVSGKYNSRFEMPEQLKSIQKTGYSFAQWDKDFEYFPEVDVLVNAEWKGNVYKVLLHNNEQTDEKEFTYGQSFILPFDDELSNITVPEGFGLSGWSLTEGSSIDYYIGTSTVFENPGDIDLYSVWDNHFYKVRIFTEKVKNYVFDVYDNPEYDTEEKIIYSAVGINSRYSPEEKEGFDILPFEQVTVLDDNTSVLDIYYSRKLLKIVRDYNGGRETNLRAPYRYDTPEIPRVNYVKYGCRIELGYSITKDGYELLKWKKADGTFLEENGFSAATQYYTVYEDLDLTLYGTPKNYTYKFHYVNGASGINSENQISFTVESDAFELPNLKLAGEYTFAGWYTDETVTSKYQDGKLLVEKGTFFEAGTSVLDLYAKWTTSNAVTVSTSVTGVGDLVLKDGRFINIPLPGVEINIDSYKDQVIGVVTHRTNNTWRVTGLKVPTSENSSQCNILTNAGSTIEENERTDDCTDGATISGTLKIDNGYKEYQGRNTSYLGYFIKNYKEKVWNNPSGWKTAFNSDWYLPAIEEYKLMYVNKEKIRYSFLMCDSDIFKIQKFKLSNGFVKNAQYWSCNIYPDWQAAVGPNAIYCKIYNMEDDSEGSAYHWDSFMYFICHKL